jgi:class 3 adenylate cyclase
MVICARCGAENPEGFSFCGACGAPLAGAPAPRQERKVISVLFCDLVGSTAQAERLDPEDVDALLSRYHARVAAEIERFGGTVEKFIGDAVVALFGVPLAHEDDPERAVRAALAIQERVPADSDVHLRVAVNTGEALVVAGARAEQGEHLASGDVLNTAARLQSAAPVDGILVGEQTYRMTRRVIDYRDHEPVRARGKPDPVPVWEAVQVRSRYGVDLAITWSTPMVGRDRELEVLASALDRACEERTVQLITLVGVPGIGKSRLLAELFAVVDQSARVVLWRQGRSLPYGEGVSFWALGEMIKAQAGILETDGPAEAEEKLAETVEHLFGDASDAGWVEAHLRALVGVVGGEAPAGGREEQFGAWRRFFDALADRRPLVLVFEDFHWADEGLLDFVDDLVDQLSDVPLLVVATARPELLVRRPTWGGGKANATTLSLSPLSDEDTSRLVNSLLARQVLADEVQSAVLERAAGNPLYAEEFVRMLGESELGSELPDSVHAIIAARLDALEAADKDLLQTAAVVGKVFWSGALAAVGGGQDPDIGQRLRALERRELVRRERRTSVEGETEYVFGHVLVRDVAYGTMPRPVRVDRHRRAAEWIQSLGRPGDHAELIAYHYESALELAQAAGLDSQGLLEPVIASCQAAGARAMLFGSWAVAAGFYRRALDLCPIGDPRRASVLARTGEAAFNADGTGLDLLREAIDALVAAGNAEQAGETASFAARAEWLQGNREAAQELVERGVSLVQGGPPTRAKALVLARRSSFHSFDGQNAEAIELAHEALEAAERAGLPDVRAHVLNILGLARASMGDDRGLADLAAAAELAGEAHAYPTVNMALNNLVEAHRQWGHPLQEAQVLKEMRASTGRYGTPHEQRWLHAVEAVTLYTAGDWDGAVREADGVTAGSRAGSTHYMEPLAHCVRAWIRLGRDDLDGADQESASAVAAVEKVKDSQAVGPTLATRARIALELGQVAEAKRLAGQVALLEPVSALLTEAQAFVDFVLLLHDLGLPEDLASVLDALPATWPWTRAGREIAALRFAPAADILSGVGHPLWEATLRLRAALALGAAGSQTEVEEQLDTALEFFRSAGATRLIRRAESLRAPVPVEPRQRRR